VRAYGLEVRAGLHTGEVEVLGAKVAGLAVNIGARVAGMAGPGEVFVSRTVRDLVAGSGLAFEDRGPAVLKGIPGEWGSSLPSSPVEWMVEMRGLEPLTPSLQRRCSPS
jgi:hypothetical protein